jgi:hypothetical protein
MTSTAQVSCVACPPTTTKTIFRGGYFESSLVAFGTATKQRAVNINILAGSRLKPAASKYPFLLAAVLQTRMTYRVLAKTFSIFIIVEIYILSVN